MKNFYYRIFNQFYLLSKRLNGRSFDDSNVFGVCLALSLLMMTHFISLSLILGDLIGVSIYNLNFDNKYILPLALLFLTYSVHWFLFLRKDKYITVVEEIAGKEDYVAEDDASWALGYFVGSLALYLLSMIYKAIYNA